MLVGLCIFMYVTAIAQSADTRANVKSLSVSAVYDDNSGEIILKIVNAGAEPLNTKIDFKVQEGFPGAVEL
jgi:alpha-L-arabinofuranosidase